MSNYDTHEDPKDVLASAREHAGAKRAKWTKGEAERMVRDLTPAEQIELLIYTMGMGQQAVTERVIKRIDAAVDEMIKTMRTMTERRGHPNE